MDSENANDGLFDDDEERDALKKRERSPSPEAYSQDFDLDSSRSKFTAKTIDSRLVEEQTRKKKKKLSLITFASPGSISSSAKDKEEEDDEDADEPVESSNVEEEENASVLIAEAADAIVENQVVQQPHLEEVAVIPRQWQMSDVEATYTILDYSCWRERYQVLRAHPIVTKEQDPVAYADRIKQLQYLSAELYSLWGTGCRGANISRTPEVQAIIDADRAARGVLPGKSVQADPIAIAYCIFFEKVQPQQLTPQLIHNCFVKINDEISEMINMHRRYNYVQDSDGRCCNSLSKLYSVQRAAMNAHHMLQHAAAVIIAIDPTKYLVMPASNVIHFVDSFEHFGSRLSDAGPQPKFTSPLIDIACSMRLRRYRNCVYEEVMTDEGHATSHWKKKFTMEEFVHEICSRDKGNVDLYLQSMTGGTVTKAVEFLNDFVDAQFPKLTLDRHVFSFKNGLYFTSTQRFRPYVEGRADWSVDAAIKSRRDIGREWMTKGEIHKTNASANFFDLNFTDYKDKAWWDIPTPTLSKMFNDQEIPEDAQRVFFGLIGRLFYTVGELDNYQVVPWILGRANTGKTTLCELTSVFYQPEDVAVISNNIEEKFGLEAVYDKLIFQAAEVKRDFRLTQAEFQQMVSGDRMSFARKCKLAVSERFSVPGMFAGNDMPQWLDNSNSVVRRIVLLMFNKQLAKVEGNIKSRLLAEIPEIIQKCNRAYHELIRQVGDEGLWDKLPEYFRVTQTKLKAKTHPVYHFFESEDLLFSPEAQMPLDTFRHELQNHMSKCCLKRQAWNEELYLVPFADRSLKLDKVDKFTWPPGTMGTLRNCVIIKGVTLRPGRPGHAQEIGNGYEEGPAATAQSPTSASNQSSAAKKTAPPKKGVGTYRTVPTFK